MENAIAKNDVQVIQKALEEFLGKRKAAKVVIEISAVMQEETQHTHKGEVGALALTMESMVKSKVEAILNSCLEKDEVQECLELLIGGQPVCETKATTESAEFETIKIEGSDSKIYASLMEHEATNNTVADFKNTLKEAISASVQDFKVFVCDPSIDKNGKLRFVPGFEPAVGYSYNELENLAKDNSLRLGNKFEYVLFLGTLIYNLIVEGWSERRAWYAVCVNSGKLGHYMNSKNAKIKFEPTGSRKIVGKCDLANTRKILAKEEKAGGFWMASGYCNDNCVCNPLANLNLNDDYDGRNRNSVGWFVL